jgi:hypothetical protein
MARRIKMGGSKKPRQSAHNKMTGKYVRQRARTARNKAKRIAKHNKKGGSNA